MTECGRQCHFVFMFHSVLSYALVVMTTTLFRLLNARTESQTNFQIVWVCISVRAQAICRVTAREKILNLLADFPQGLYTPKISLRGKLFSKALYTDDK